MGINRMALTMQFPQEDGGRQSADANFGPEAGPFGTPFSILCYRQPEQVRGI